MVMSTPETRIAPNKKTSRRSRVDKDFFLEASQSQLIWYRFKKHRLAAASLMFLALLYFVAVFADFFAPYEQNYRIPGAQLSAPTPIGFYIPEEGLTRPFVHRMERELDQETFTYETVPVPDERVPVRFFVKGSEYRILGLLPARLRLFGVEDGYIALFGTDQLGIDIFSQTLYAARISLSVPLVGVTISFIIGVILGGISGFFGGWVDDVVQRLIEFLMGLPQLPLWIALSAAIPMNWTGIQTFFAITVILSLVGWTNLARVVRGRLLSLREEDYVPAAVISGASDKHIIARHLLPGVMSYLVVNVSLAIPHMILGETTLSFLGLGILPPEVSWGSMMQQARSLTVIFNYSWHLIPTIFIVLSVLAFNFVGDGLRDAADPYSL